MLSAVRAGTVDVVLAYSNSRLTRRPRELEDLIDLHRDSGVLIKTVVSGEDDLSTADGRMVARIRANVDAAEAERTGERVKRQKQQRLEAGLPLGSRYRTYGYTREWAQHAEEAPIVREVFERFNSGESINSITKDLVARGLQTVSGKPWRFAVTHRMLENPTYAGLLSYKGEVIGKATVPALVSEAAFTAANSDRQKKAGFNARTHLLSGTLVCDLCNAPMSGAVNAHGVARYRCNMLVGGCGRVSIKAAYLDDLVNNFIAYMLVLDADEDSPEPVADDNRLAAKDADIAKIRAADIDLDDKFALLKEARADRAAILKEQAHAVSAVAAEWKPIEDYDSADVSIKRVAVSRYIKRMVVKKSETRKPVPAHARFTVFFADGHPMAGQERLGVDIDVVDLRSRIGSASFPSEF
jgi:hypothetical protein